MMVRVAIETLRLWRRRRTWRRNGVVLGRFCRVVDVDFLGRATLEEGCRLIGDPKIVVGDNFYANVDCHFLGQISFGRDVLIGPKTVIWGRDHGCAGDRPIREQDHVKQPIRVGDDVWIGANCTILKGVTIGTGAVVGAGSVVVRDIPEYAVAVGNPARIVRRRRKACPDEGRSGDGILLRMLRNVVFR